MSLQRGSYKRSTKAENTNLQILNRRKFYKHLIPRADIENITLKNKTKAEKIQKKCLFYPPQVRRTGVSVPEVVLKPKISEHTLTHIMKGTICRGAEGQSIVFALLISKEQEGVDFYNELTYSVKELHSFHLLFFVRFKSSAKRFSPQ